MWGLAQRKNYIFSLGKSVNKCKIKSDFKAKSQVILVYAVRFSRPTLEVLKGAPREGGFCLVRNSETQIIPVGGLS